MSTEIIHLDDALLPIVYAWPGGYPVYYLEADADAFREEYFVACARCARKAKEREVVLVAQEVNWEDDDLSCDNCSSYIESAYPSEDLEMARRCAVFMIGDHLRVASFADALVELGFSDAVALRVAREQVGSIEPTSS